MNKANQRAEIQEALKNFTGKQGVPYSKEDRFHKEIKGRESDKKDNYVPLSNRGKESYRT